MNRHIFFLTYWVELGSISGSFSLLEPIANCGVVVEMESSIFVVSSFEYATKSFKFGGKLSSLTSLLVIKLVDIRTSNFLLQANSSVSYALSSTS